MTPTRTLLEVFDKDGALLAFYNPEGNYSLEQLLLFTLYFRNIKDPKDILVEFDEFKANNKLKFRDKVLESISDF